MVTLEKVEKLREYANISYDEAKKALENADGDILQALIDLERQGKVQSPKGGGQYHTSSVTITNNTQQKGNDEQSKNSHEKTSAFGKNMKKLFVG